MSAVRIALVLVILAAALAIPAAVVFARDGHEAEFRGSRPPVDIALPYFNLRDQNGKLVRTTDLAGKAAAITFLDAQCTDACPIIAAQLSQAVRTLGGKESGVQAVAFSVDPEQDTPKQVRAFLKRYKATDEIRYLNGTRTELEPLWRAFSVLPTQGGDSNLHSAPVRIYDKNGRWRSTLSPGADLTTANLAHDLREAMSKS
jgi:protein SCO1